MNILLISSIYPLPSSDNQGTPVCHYFTREWVKMGYNVRVVHFQAVYPAPFYWVARANRNAIAARTGAVVYTEKDRGAEYEMDGVKINRIPLFKPIPHGSFSKRAIKKSIQRVVDWCNDSFFTPDVIVGHFPNPQIEVLGKLKEYYPNATTAIVLHGDIELMKKVYGDNLYELCKKIDLWGFRSKPIQDEFMLKVMQVEHSFICYSGIPENYITLNNTHAFERPVRRFVYVGEMIERKYPMQVLDALQIAYPDGDFEMTYVGSGQLLESIQRRVATCGLEKRVSILGKIPRNSIKEQYDNADCMVMISRGEAYGLVYLEAMARGCITIASEGEGFDGIIRDGENGFLCKAGDTEILASIIRRIREMSRVELQRMSNAAIVTAKWLTDTSAAKMYVENLCNTIIR